jgi:hypothetical protein
MGNLIDKSEFEKLNPQEIRKQIEIRDDLITEMVGWLYPRIIQSEIDTLEELLESYE